MAAYRESGGDHSRREDCLCRLEFRRDSRPLLSLRAQLEFAGAVIGYENSSSATIARHEARTVPPFASPVPARADGR
jgi:hypothetical protein